MSIKVKRTQETLSKINDLFHTGKDEALADIYTILKKHGFDYRKCILIHTCPDGGRSYFGSIIVPGGRVMDFDIDPDCPEYNEWKDETAIRHAEYQYYKLRKPWLNIVVAYEMFYAMQQS